MQLRKKIFLEWLFYKINSQRYDIELQIQNKNSFMSKRKSYLKLIEEENEWFLNKSNARTILRNEIVIDLDPEKIIKEEIKERKKQEYENFLKEIVEEIKRDFKNKKITKDGVMTISNRPSRGIHISIYNREYEFPIFRNQEEIDEDKKEIITAYQGDLLKVSYKTTINLEFSKHWKTGIEKELTEILGVGFWGKERAEELKKIIILRGEDKCQNY